MTTPPSGTGDAPQTTVYEYDVAGRAWKVIHPDGGIVNTTYTARGEVATTYGARSYPVEHTYDSHGRMKTLKTWQNKTAGTGAAVTTWTYDIYRGWLTAKKYEGRTTSVEYEYTPGGRLKLRRWERNASTGGRLVTTYRHGIPAESALGLPADGGLHRIEYGATAVGTPEVRYTYDRAGRRISTRQFNGATELRRVDWQPDETGAFGAETLVESGATTFTLTRGADSVLRPGSLTLQRTATNVLAMTYGYDTASRLTSVSDGTLSATYAYQANSDLLSTITLRNGATTRLTTTRVYDRWGRLQSQWAVANAASVQPVVGSGYTYNAAGQRIRQDLGDGTYWTYAYDALGQLTGAQRRWPDGTLVAGQQYGYLYDDIGNRKQSQEGGDANGAGLQTTTYTANLLNQYSSITTPGVASVNGLANATNTVTVNGAATARQGEYWWRETSVANAAAPVWASLNVAASNGGTTNTTVNRYVPKANETPTYDDDGNQTGDGRWIYRWDAENRLVEMETTSTAITAGVPYVKVRWTYDPLGRRTQRESWQGANPSVVTKYVYDGWQCLAELDGSNAVTATYAWGLDLSSSRTGAGGVGGLLWVNHTQHGRHFYSYDGNGNVCGLTSATDGTRTGGYEYDPFGGIIRANEAHPVAGWNEWRSSTKRTMPKTAATLYEYRCLDLATGKWLNRDPAGERGGVGVYGFIANRTIDRGDLLGLALYAFDGTNNDGVNDPDPTNISILHDIYEESKFYMHGVGTREGKKWQTILGMAGGYGGENRIEAMMVHFRSQLKAGDEDVDIIGFSRGAAMAREFVNRVMDEYPCLRIRFLGLFDTVASFGLGGNDINLGYRLAIPDGVQTVMHITALDERRYFFPLSSILSGSRPAYPPYGGDWWEFALPGVHSDIGGGYSDRRQFANRALKLMHAAGLARGVPFGPIPSEFLDTDTGGLAPHDSRWSNDWVRDYIDRTNGRNPVPRQIFYHHWE